MTIGCSIHPPFTNQLKLNTMSQTSLKNFEHNLKMIESYSNKLNSSKKELVADMISTIKHLLLNESIIKDSLEHSFEDSAAERKEFYQATRIYKLELIEIITTL